MIFQQLASLALKFISNINDLDQFSEKAVNFVAEFNGNPDTPGLVNDLINLNTDLKIHRHVELKFNEIIKLIENLPRKVQILEQKAQLAQKRTALITKYRIFMRYLKYGVLNPNIIDAFSKNDIKEIQILINEMHTIVAAIEQTNLPELIASDARVNVLYQLNALHSSSWRNYLPFAFRNLIENCVAEPRRQITS